MHTEVVKLKRREENWGCAPEITHEYLSESVFILQMSSLLSTLYITPWIVSKEKWMNEWFRTQPEISPEMHFTTVLKLQCWQKKNKLVYVNVAGVALR